MRKENVERMKARRRNICLTVAYDGTNYHGFQRQTPPVVAVQNVLEKKLREVFGDDIELAAAGRTDTGVHAWGQVVNFFTDGAIPTERIVRAVNSILPSDIVVREAREEARDFSARHSAKHKTYIYRILQGEVPNPFLTRYAWHERRKLDTAKMGEAIKLLLGEHDFSSFRATGGAPMSPVRTIDEASVSKKGDMIKITLGANGFLYHMVRNIVGTLADVGLGRKSVNDFAEILASKDRHRAGATAPAHGLIFYKVEY